MSWIMTEIFKYKAQSTVNEGLSSLKQTVDPEPEKKSTWDSLCDAVNDGMEDLKESVTGSKAKKADQIKKSRENREKVRAKYGITDRKK